MSEHADTIPLDDVTLVEFAAELRRLANEVVRDVRRGTPLPGLSHLVAMRPLQEMLTRTLSNRVLGDSTESATTDVSGQEPEIPGYL
jgi:hypothetical protein